MSNHTPRRINRLADLVAASSYLEIGVESGISFREVRVEYRTGVDPLFLFDTGLEVNERTRFVRCTSDEFFDIEPLRSQFDIIFIDGLHTFEQVLRDLMNAMSRAHDHSAFLIDDVWPNDIYSAIPDRTMAMEMRWATGNKDESWHGDVFKIVHFIHDFLPCLNYRTVTGSGNPQLLTWFSNKSPRQPRLGSLEAISRLSYFQFLAAPDIMRACDEEEALQLCATEIGANLK